MTTKEKKYQDPTEFIKLVNSDRVLLKPTRYFYRELENNKFGLYFNNNIDEDPNGNSAIMIMELTSKFVAYRLVTTLNRTLLHCNHDFEQTVARQSNFITK